MHRSTATMECTNDCHTRDNYAGNSPRLSTNRVICAQHDARIWTTVQPCRL